MSTVFLIPSFLAAGATESIPPYVLSAVKSCTVIFAENERTARRFLKTLDKNIAIEDFEWFTIHKAEEQQTASFKLKIQEGKNIAIISEAGCPGVADPGQLLISVAQKMHCIIKPLVGPNAILLALMGSGLNGQQFEFVGYLPIEKMSRDKKIRELEAASAKHESTKIFIETPFRNNQVFESIVQNCRPESMLCIGANITATDERIITKTIAAWKTSLPDINKIPAIFLLYAGR